MRIGVLGAGIVGLSTAEWLRRDGHSVTLLDRIEPGDPAQTSYGNAGILSDTSVVPVPVPGLLAKAPRLLFSREGALFLKWAYLPRLLPWLVPYLRAGRLREVERISRALGDLIGDTVEQHRALAASTGAERFIEPSGYTFLYRDRDEWQADALGNRLRAEAGVAFEERPRAALLAEDPHLGPAYGFGIRFRDSGWVRDPGGYARALFAHYRREGGGFVQGDIHDIVPGERGVEVVHAGKRTHFDHIVLAMGVWSARLAKRLGHRPQLESERGYHLVLKNPNRRPPVPYMLADAKSVATPMDAGVRLAGLVEFGGLKAAPTEAAWALQRRRVRALYPDLTWEDEVRWMGHRPSTVDSLPLLGASPKARGVWFAFGAQHLGLTTGPKSGRLIADMIAGRTPNIDLTPCRVGRFDGA